MQDNILEMRDITKSFFGVKVLKNAQLTVKKGQVHILLGENGAGKSTLIKILSGAYGREEGTVILDGNEMPPMPPGEVIKAGVSVIYQEFNLVPEMSVYENIFLGKEIVKGGRVDHKKEIEEAKKCMDRVGLDCSPKTLISELSVAKKQLVEIAKAISNDVKILVLDEPTAAITDKETEMLFDIIRELKKQGIGIIYISHRLSELLEIGDVCTVMRDGEYIDTVVTKETTHDDLVALMVGRKLGDLYQKHENYSDDIILKVEKLASGKEVKNVDFELRRGEVLGFSGLVGSGRSETMECIFGLRHKDSGHIYIENKEVDIKNVKTAINAGIGLVPEDRKQSGIYPIQGIRFNATIEILDKFLKKGRYNRKKEIELARKYVDEVMQTKYSSIEQEIGKLSGGNQQKVIISRWLLVTEKILILDEPTRGIDVKTKSDIYHLIDDLTATGLSIIFISSEMPELINMCDRIVVMNQGHTTGILNRNEFNQEKIMAFATKEIG